MRVLEGGVVVEREVCSSNLTSLYPRKPMGDYLTTSLLALFQTRVKPRSKYTGEEKTIENLRAPSRNLIYSLRVILQLSTSFDQV